MSDERSDPRPEAHEISRENGREEGWLERLIGRFSGRHRDSTRDDLEEVLAEATEQGDLSPRERLMLKNVLGFHRVRISDVMVPRADIVAVSADMTLGSVLALFRTAGHSRLPAYGETLDEPLGMVHIRDFVDHLASGGTGASNIIPGSVVVDFNFRFSTESTPESLQQRVEAVLQKHGLEYELKWTLGGLPFLTTPGDLVTAVQAAIHAETGLETELSTTGGTSDGRFIAQICPQVIELGPPNASIHKIDEHIALADIEPLKNIYRRVLENLAAA